MAENEGIERWEADKVQQPARVGAKQKDHKVSNLNFKIRTFVNFRIQTFLNFKIRTFFLNLKIRTFLNFKIRTFNPQDTDL